MAMVHEGYALSHEATCGATRERRRHGCCGDWMNEVGVCFLLRTAGNACSAERSSGKDD
jgi:hypothetical protein